MTVRDFVDGIDDLAIPVETVPKPDIRALWNAAWRDLKIAGGYLVVSTLSVVVSIAGIVTQDAGTDIGGAIAAVLAGLGVCRRTLSARHTLRSLVKPTP
jgi:hypothetical protein